jgi:hypothetical protein
MAAEYADASAAVWVCITAAVVRPVFHTRDAQQ